MAQPGGIQRDHQLWNQQVVGRQRTDADDIHVLLKCQRHNRVNRLPGVGIDHLHPRIAQIGGDDATATIMSIQTDLGHQHPRRS